MKALCSLATLSLALFLTACSATQQQQQQAAGTADEPSAIALTERPGNIFNTRGKRPQADKEKEPEAAPVPTEEQQLAAQAILPESEKKQPAESQAPIPAPEEEPTPLADTAPSGFPQGGLRMGNILPQEDSASATDAPAPAANAAERFGLRSPKMPAKLPMGIDGKLQNAQ